VNEIIEAVQGLDLARWILPAALAAGGVLLGLLSEGYVLVRMRRGSDRPGWSWMEAFVSAVRRMTFVWFTVAGAYAALLTVELPEHVRTLADRTLMAAFLFSLTVVAARLAASGVRFWARQSDTGLPSTSLLQNVARIGVFALGLVIVLQNLGIQIGALVAGLGIGGLAVALALQDTLSNLFAGFQIILARQVRQGDYVVLDTGEEGYITDIQWRNTTIRSRIDDNEVIVPNSRISSTIVTNFSRPASPFWVRLEVGVSYASDLEKVEEVAAEVAREVLEELGSGGEPEIVVRFQSFGDSSVNFVLRARVPSYVDQYRTRHELVKKLHARFAEEGIQIPFPIRTVYTPEGVSVRTVRETDEEKKTEGRSGD
jgi:small-conductance mechanosensitive channel